MTFARAWVDAWNRRDLEAVLAHYAEDASFLSPRAKAATGNALVQGKPALRAYWSMAPVRFPDLHFTLDRALWDPAARALTVLYVSRRSGTAQRAAEIMRFGNDGLIEFGEALYGAEVD